MKMNKYYKILIKLLPQEIVDKYDLNNNQIYGCIYFRFKNRTYGLVQSGIIVHEALKTHLKLYCYVTERIT